MSKLTQSQLPSTTIPQLNQALLDLFTVQADELAKSSHFRQRDSKLRGSVFAKSVVFAFMENPSARLDDIAQYAGMNQVSISAQGLDSRFNQDSAQFLKGILGRITQTLVRTTPSTQPILDRFTQVEVMDSTVTVLPAELVSEWKGNGGKGSKAAVKCQYCFDIRTGEISHLSLVDGKSQDRNAAVQYTIMPKGSLRLADLGYFNLNVFEEVDKQESYWLSRLQVGVKVYVAVHKIPDLADWLDRQCLSERDGMAYIDVPVKLGDKAQLNARLIAAPVPQAVADERRRQLKRSNAVRGTTPSKLALCLAGWTVLVCNIPADKLRVKEVFILKRIRWQIEKVFDWWKSYKALDKSRSKKVWRRLCEFYAKLIGLIIQHWFVVVCA